MVTLNFKFSNANLMAVYCILSRYFKLVSIVQTLVAITGLYTQADCKLEEKLMKVSLSDECICSGDTVMYECTVIGDNRGFTLWMGDFFQCSNGNKVLELQHHQFMNIEEGGLPIARICNNGNISGRLIRVENGSYTSQLNVTLTSDVVGRSIECAYDNGTIYRIGSLNLTTGFASRSPPASVSWATIISQFDTIRTFTWNTHSPCCPAIHYNILASNCGSCPTTTSDNNVTCTGIPTDGSTCVFALETVVCGIITEELSRVSLLNSITPGSSENRSALFSAVCLGVVLFICLIGLIVVIILLIKYKIKFEKAVLNTTADKVKSRETSESVTQSSRISTKKNISYVVHTPRTESDVISNV